jgi:dephospho-CoA kinase
MDMVTAVMRIDAQSPQEEKVAKADVVIDTDGLMDDTRRQFERAWSRLLLPEK